MKYERRPPSRRRPGDFLNSGVDPTHNPKRNLWVYIPLGYWLMVLYGALPNCHREPRAVSSEELIKNKRKRRAWRDSGWWSKIQIFVTSKFEPRRVLGQLSTPAWTAPTTSSETTSPSELTASLSQSYRQSLCFPLYRSFLLAEACREAVAALFPLRKRAIVRCLLETKFILDHHEVYYVYSKIWLADFCVWVQAPASDDTLREIGAAVKILPIPKRPIGWVLELLEAATQEVQARQVDSDDESDEENEVARQL
ncbi:SHQ1 protein-domain-containing protein [Mycena capillaripes]|nr:SHQ1 protein-domain-containing protein [Mycena capillaripes]